MSLPSFVKQRPPSDAGEIDLDVTPLMSIFLILIPFLVSMVVLTHLTILNFSLPPNVGAGAAASRSSDKPTVKLMVVVAPAYIAITRGETLLDSIPSIVTGYNLDSLRKQLIVRRTTSVADSQVVVASADNIRLKHVVAIMDECKRAGFAAIGLSSATSDPGKGR